MGSSPNDKSLDELFSLIYEELRRLARAVLRSEYAAEVSPTTLVHEAWLKLEGTPALATTSPLHFRRIAARAMRQILVDAARRRNAKINGGGLMRVDFDACLNVGGAIKERELLALDVALEELRRHRPRQAQVVEARYFGGFTCSECAELLGISEETVLRDWRVARAWLICEVKQSLDPQFIEAMPHGTGK